MKNDRYYYIIMNREEREIYKTIYNGLSAYSLNIVISLDVTPETVQETYLKVLYDNPHFYYINQTVIKMAGHTGYYILMPEYIYNISEINVINSDIQKIINKVTEKAQTFLTDEFRLEKYLHDSIAKSVAYDYDSLKRNDCFNAHSIVGVFLDNKAVCEGIAKAFKLLCNQFGMKCIVVLGKANHEGDFSKDDYHAWNLVKIGNESYHVDVTWDNMYHEDIQYISYDYFNLTTKEIMLDHQVLSGVSLPECSDSRLNYFYCTNSFVATYQELFEFIVNRFNENKIIFRAVTDKGEFTSPEELREKTLSALLHTSHMNRNTRPFSVIFNDKHNTVNIVFRKEQPKKIDLTKHNKPH